MGLAVGAVALGALAQVPCIATPAEYAAAVRERAVAIAQGISRDRAAFQRERRTLNGRFGQMPKPSLELFGLRGGQPIGEVAEVAQRTGIPPELLNAAMVQEGLDAVMTMLGPNDPIDGFGALGVDGFATDMEMLKRQGFLRRDYDGITMPGSTGFADETGQQNADPAKNIYWVNEAGQRYRSFDFKNLRAAAEAMSAYLRYKQSLFLRDARALGIDTANMDPLTLAGWTYLYYNAGEGLGRRILQSRSGRIPAFTARQGAAIRNANRVMAAIVQYRNRNLYPDPSTVGSCAGRQPGAPNAGANVGRGAATNGAAAAGTPQPAGTAIPAGWSQ